METSLVVPRPGGRSRFSKALPAPPPPLENTKDVQVVLPIRKDSLPPRPVLPPKDNAVRSIPPNMATKVMDAALPQLPSLSRVNSPPTAMPKRKPVGSGISIKSAKSPPPPPPPVDGGEISPVESFSSLFSAYGTEDSSAARYSVDTEATKHSFSEPSPPKLPPKNSLGAGVNNRLERLDIVSPLSLATPVSSNMDINQQQSEPSWAKGNDTRPPTPPKKDNQRPTTPQSSKFVNDSPTSLNNQSPSQPQLWRRRSLKSVKPLAVPQLKLTSSHGSTASSQQATSTMNNGLPLLSDLEHSSDGTAGDSPILNGFDANFPGRNIRPSPSQKSLPRHPSPDKMGNHRSKEGLDGFSQYAQEVENSMGEGTFKTPQFSPARLSPEIQRPPTPEYAKDEARSDDPVIYSPVSPMTPPDDPRPLSVIQEAPEVLTTPAPSALPSGPLPSLSARSPSIPGAGGAPAASPGRIGLPRSPRPSNRSPLGTSSPATAPAPAAVEGLAPSPAIQPVASTTLAHMRSSSSISIPAIEVTDDGDTSTIGAPSSPQPVTSASSTTTTITMTQQTATLRKEGPVSPTSPTAPRPGDPAYFPMRHYYPGAELIAPGTVLTAAPPSKSQLECFGQHYRFLPSRNEEHPLACQSCQVRDRGARFTCAHCAVRICADCRDVLMVNGRDLGKLVEMLKD